MNSKQLKMETAGLIDVMIQQSDKGPSGFWTDDYEGCGNPKIFPKFEKGLKHGNYIHLNYCTCPWSTSVLYGKEQGVINNGCSDCSISDAWLLSSKMLKTVLLRFKKKMLSGYYDHAKQLAPLLSEEEQSYIIEQRRIKEKEIERQEQIRRENRIISSKQLVVKFADNQGIQQMIIDFYGENKLVCYGPICIDFSKNGMVDIVGCKRLSYDDYIELQFKSLSKNRADFAKCFYALPTNFNGRVDKKTDDKVCFNRVCVSGMFLDGNMFVGKEDHVWMDISGFDSFQVGDCVSFSAEVYRYVKTGNGKILDFALRAPTNIKKIESYKLPTDEELVRQEIRSLICETCCLHDKCDQLFCLMSPDVKEQEDFYYRLYLHSTAQEQTSK